VRFNSQATMRRRAAITFVVFCALGMLANLPALAQQPMGQRKVLSKAMPEYPEFARRMNLAGTVKLAVTVAPNGSVKSVQTVGGNPVLLRAAEGAIYKWKWAPAAQDSKELVELSIHPE
jgi:TonB family protein